MPNFLLLCKAFSTRIKLGGGKKFEMFLLSVTETLKLKSISCKSLWVIGWSYWSISSLQIIRYMNQSCLFPISFFFFLGSFLHNFLVHERLYE